MPAAASVPASQPGRATGAPAGSSPGPTYERRRPEETTLYRVVQQNLLTLYAAVEGGFEGGSLPKFVKDDLDGFLGCGLLCRGFAHLRCADCDEQAGGV